METIPDEWNDIIYAWQEAEIRKRIQEPIAWVGWSDPAWPELDRLAVADTLYSDLSDTGVECTLHEMVPGKFVVWLQDTATQHSGEEIILISASDLKIIRESGHFGLQIATLLKDF